MTLPYLAAAVGLLGALCLINLAVLILVIKRLRAYLEELASRPRGMQRMPVGTQISGFTATTATGSAVSLSDLTGSRSVVAFLSVSCGPCRTQLPEFKEHVRGVPGGASQVLAVLIARDSAGAAEFAKELAGLATIVVEAPRSGPVQDAFNSEGSVFGYPSFFALDERGKVEASGPTVGSLKVLAVGSSKARRPATAKA
jgi:peroxiredoxin